MQQQLIGQSDLQIAKRHMLYYLARDSVQCVVVCTAAQLAYVALTRLCKNKTLVLQLAQSINDTASLPVEARQRAKEVLKLERLPPEQFAPEALRAILKKESFLKATFFAVVAFKGRHLATRATQLATLMVTNSISKWIPCLQPNFNLSHVAFWDLSWEMQWYFISRVIPRSWHRIIRSLREGPGLCQPIAPKKLEEFTSSITARDLTIWQFCVSAPRLVNFASKLLRRVWRTKNGHLRSMPAASDDCFVTTVIAATIPAARQRSRGAMATECFSVAVRLSLVYLSAKFGPGLFAPSDPTGPAYMWSTILGCTTR